MKNIVRYFHQSLSLKLSIGVLLMTALIFFATLGIVFVESRRNIRQESIEHAASVLNNVAQNISRYLNMRRISVAISIPSRQPQMLMHGWQLRRSVLTH